MIFQYKQGRIAPNVMVVMFLAGGQNGNAPIAADDGANLTGGRNEQKIHFSKRARQGQ
jgi:hypothetical protein